MSQPFTPVSSGARLSDQVADQLAAEIRRGGLAPGDRLPTEARLVEQFGVSRTVVREAVSRLKSLGLVDSRQGSGVFVRQPSSFAPLNFEAQHAASQEAVIQMVEVRRALEAEVAALAAQRRSAADMQRIEAASRQVLAAELRLASLRKVLAARRKEIELQQARRDQKQTDERAAIKYHSNAIGPLGQEG